MYSSVHRQLGWKTPASRASASVGNCLDLPPSTTIWSRHAAHTLQPGVPIETMRELLDYDDEVSAVEIRVKEGTSDKGLQGLVSQLEERLGPGFTVLDRYRQNEALYKMMRYEKLAIYMILIFIVIIIAFNIYSSLTMLIIEKKDDIGTLRSLGAPESMTRRIFLLEGWLISLLGLAIGLVLGIAFVLLQQKYGLIRMPGNYIINAYPVILKASALSSSQRCYPSCR